MKLKSHLRFNKQEQSGIFFLLFLIVLVQGVYFYVTYNSASKANKTFALNKSLQYKIDSLKAKALEKDTVAVYPFNPNFISDYKGYVLGMSVDEIDRLHAFRAKNKYVNSTSEFQEITKVSDSLLKSISKYFKFPKWKNAKSNHKIAKKSSVKSSVIKDINSATVNDFKSIYGIGDKLSGRIVKFRDKLGGFFVNEQLYDVYGLENEVVERALKHFQVLKTPVIRKININTASVIELYKLPYIQKKVAYGILDYRNDNKTIKSFDELLKIENFPKDKIDKIKLYLTLK